MRTMYDAVQAGNIPADAAMVAGYLDGPRSQWSASDWARFPAAVKVGITVFADSNDGHVLDVETGDAEPGQAPGWVRMRRNAGADPTVYCNMSTWPLVKEAFAASGIAPPHYWIADPTGTPHLLDGTIATQHTFAGPYDVSEVADYWPGVDNGQTIQPVEADAAMAPQLLQAAPVTPAEPAPAPTAPDPAAAILARPEVSRAALALIAAIAGASQAGS